MTKRSLRMRLIDVPAFFVFCLLLVWPVFGQSPDNSGKPLDVLFEEYKTARKQTCGQRDEALRIGREIVARFSDDALNKEVIDYVKIDTTRITENDKKCREANSLETLFEDYKILRKQTCGERNKAVATGKRIIEMYGGDEQHQYTIVYLEKDIAAIEKQERECQRFADYNEAYKKQNWRGFLSYGRQIIEAESDPRLALDTMLSFVAVGYKLTAYGKNDFYNSDTLRYAEKALDLIESGARTKARWGNVEAYETKQKALAWMNYVIGYITYFRSKEGRKAIPYFYKATQYSAEFKYDAFVYQAVAIHYFEKQAVTVSSLTINDFLTRAGGLVSELNDAPTDANSIEIVTLYKQLGNLYNLRYNLAPEENVTGFTEYILKLINRPLLDTAKTKMSDTTSRR